MKHKDLLAAEAKASQEYAESRKVSRIVPKDDTSDFHAFDEKGDVKASFLLEDVKCPWKQLIFRALKAAYTQIFIHEETAEGNKESFNSFAQDFWFFVKAHPHFKGAYRTRVIKDFEAFKITTDKVKPLSAGLNEIKRLINISLTLKGFVHSLSAPEREYLYTITEVKAAPKYHDIKPINLNTWFTQHSWLRTNEYGVGDAAYTSLGLPKRLISSFSVTTVAGLEQIQQAKAALIEFFNKAQITPELCPKIGDKDEFDSPNKYNQHQKECYQKLLQLIVENRDKGADTPHFDKAMELILYSNVNEKYLAQQNRRLDTPPPLASIIISHPVFHCDFLRQLIDSLNSKNQELKKVPVCRAEEIFFCWSMAVLSVQATNICGKRGVTLSDFKFVREGSGTIKHISCDYFKTRAGKTHRTATLPADRYMGKVLVDYIGDVTAFVDYESKLVSRPYGNPVFSKSGDVARSLRVFEVASFRKELERQLSKYQASNIFYLSVNKMLENGVRRLDIKRQKLDDIEIETEVAGTFFGLSMVKTSAVYSRSAYFDPNKLLNFNSHSNETERKSYLTKNNIEWLNNCGRVTRSVFKDLITNVFRPSQKDLAKFNTEFTEALDFINSKKDESLALQVFVEENDDNKKDELGVVADDVHQEDTHTDSFYVEDSKWTVMKMLHYKNGVKDNHKKLFEQNPTYFFSTVIPTLEWIEELLSGDYFSSRNVADGQELYERFGKELPDVFIPKAG